MRSIFIVTCANQDSLLDGAENGQFLALDLGGTNFRVIKLQLEKGKIVNEIIDYYQVEEQLRLGPGPNLFKFLAECIKDFIQKNNLGQEKDLPLGFTFSFPMTQKALDVGLLVNWTKVKFYYIPTYRNYTIYLNIEIDTFLIFSSCRVLTALGLSVRMLSQC